MISGDAIDALCSAAASLGVASLRAPLLAIRVARAAAALDGQDTVLPAHLETAARLVLAPRATALPAPPEAEAEQPPEKDATEPDVKQEDKPLDDIVLEAAQAAIPSDLLRRLQEGLAMRQRNISSGKQGASKSGPRRGRPIGARRGELRAGARPTRAFAGSSA